MTWTTTLSIFITLFVVGASSYDRLRKVASPYGRFSTVEIKPGQPFEWKSDQPCVSRFCLVLFQFPTNGKGKKTKRIEARVAWFLLEAPNVLLGTLIFFTAYLTGTGSSTGWLVSSLFLLHYLIRLFIYSLLVRGAKPFPLNVVIYGIIFTSINGTIQVYHHLFEVKYHYQGTWIYVHYLRILWGLSLFFTGFFVNQWSDTVLRRLRKDDNDKNYYIPHGILFDYVSSPNLVGGK